MDGFSLDSPNLHLCPVEVISSCPDYFSDWKINNQCLTDPTTYLRDFVSGRIFRNAACAVCHGAVHAELNSISSPGDIPDVNLNSKEDHFNLHLLNDSAVCCRTCSNSQSECVEVNTTNWGSFMHPKTQQCRVVPFRGDCDQVPGFNIGQGFSLEDLCPDFDIICPATSLATRAPEVAFNYVGVIEPIEPVGIRTSILKELFDPNSKTGVSRETVVKTEWVEDNSTYLLCGNESIRNPLTGSNYKTLQLHQGMVKVRYNMELKNEVLAQNYSLEKSVITTARKF